MTEQSERAGGWDRRDYNQISALPLYVAKERCCQCSLCYFYYYLSVCGYRCKVKLTLGGNVLFHVTKRMTMENTFVLIIQVAMSVYILSLFGIFVRIIIQST